jgi:hypothetical protein
MNILPSTCVLTITSNIYPVDGPTGITALYDDIQNHNTFIQEYNFAKKWTNYDISYEKTWDALNTIENLYKSSDESTRAIISSKYDMSKIAEIKETIIDTLRENAKSRWIISSDYEEFRYTKWSYYIHNENKPISKRKVYIESTCSTQCCISCEKQLPFDWQSKEEYMYGICSSNCLSNILIKHNSTTRKCAYNKCKIQIPLYELDDINYADFCSNCCAEDDYEDKHTFNRLDAYLDRHW